MTYGNGYDESEWRNDLDAREAEITRVERRELEDEPDIEQARRSAPARNVATYPTVCDGLTCANCGQHKRVGNYLCDECYSLSLAVWKDNASEKLTPLPCEAPASMMRKIFLGAWWLVFLAGILVLAALLMEVRC